ncbi:hypothetical protein Tco_0882374 [Tanacetum coccineum]
MNLRGTPVHRQQVPRRQDLHDIVRVSLVGFLANNEESLPLHPAVVPHGSPAASPSVFAFLLEVCILRLSLPGLPELLFLLEWGT